MKSGISHFPASKVSDAKERAGFTVHEVRRGKAALASVVAVAIVLRLVWWVSTVSVIENEGGEYARLAENLFAGKGYVGLMGPNIVFPPLYSVLIGLFGFAVGDLEVGGRIVSRISGIALVAVLFLLSRQLFGTRAGMLSGLLAAVHPVLVALSVSVFSESLSMLLAMLGAYFAVQTMCTRSLRFPILSGVSLALGYLVRPELLLFTLIVSLICCLWVLVQDRRWLPALRQAMVPPSWRYCSVCRT